MSTFMQNIFLWFTLRSLGAIGYRAQPSFIPDGELPLGREIPHNSKTRVSGTWILWSSGLKCAYLCPTCFSVDHFVHELSGGFAASVAKEKVFLAFCLVEGLNKLELPRPRLWARHGALERNLNTSLAKLSTFRSIRLLGRWMLR